MSSFRGDDYVVSDSAAFKLGVHRLVIVVIAVIDLDPGELFEFLVDIEGILGSVGYVFAPVEDVQRRTLEVARICSGIYFISAVSFSGGAAEKRNGK